MKRSLVRAFVDAGHGIANSVIRERNLRIHLVVAALALILSAILRISMTQWALIIICIGLVIALELVNTAVEELVDLVCPSKDPRARRAKDIAAGAVLITAVMAVVVGLIVFVQAGIRLLS